MQGREWVLIHWVSPLLLPILSWGLKSMGTGSGVRFDSSLRFSEVSSLLETHWAWRGAG